MSIVGCGRAGGAIGLALKRNGYEIAAAWSRSRGGRQRAQRLLDVPVLPGIPDVSAAADVVFVTVPDGAIEEVGRSVATGIRPGRLAVHTSGVVSIDALAPVRDAGGRIGSLHPLQTLPDAKAGADALSGAAVAVTCEAADEPALQRIARGWGGRPFSLPDAGKAIYHAAAVFASNYVVSSVWAAVRLFEKLGVHNAQQLIAPLAQASMHNVVSMQPGLAITGPVVRGDTETVRLHVAELRASDPTGGRITEAYRAMARLTAMLSGADVQAFEKATA